MTWTYEDLIFKEPTETKKNKIRRCIVLQSEGLSDAEIAKQLGYKNVISVSGLRVSRWFHEESQRMADKLQNPVGKRIRRMTADDHNRIRELHRQGLNNEQIAAAMPEWADSTIQRHIKKLGLRPPRKAHLSDEEKAEIVRLREQEEMSHKQIALEIGRPESTVSAFCVKHFGYTRSDLIEKQQNGTSDLPGDTSLKHQKQSFHFRSIAFLPSPRRSPQEITHEVSRSLRDNPTFCDSWHARECGVLETLVARIRSQMGIPTVRDLKRITL